jgi:uncharacterized protein (DUF1697 family)
MQDESVSVYVVLLRGVNVGGVKLPMAELRRVVVACGFADPRTYIQSGNLVFASKRRAIDKIAADLRSGLKAELSLDIPMIIRTRAELKSVIDANPFIRDGHDADQQSVSFFADAVDADLFGDVDLERYSPEALRIHAREVYFNLPLGTGHSPMLKDIGRRKGLAIGTMRNWRTVSSLLDLADEVSG